MSFIDTPQRVVNKYGNVRPKFAEVVHEAEEAFMENLKPTLDSITLTEARILLNYAMASMLADAEYMLIRQTKERKAERLAKEQGK